MAANPYDPVTTTDSTHLADDEWDLPPIRLKGYPRTSCFKSLCDTVRRHPKYVLIGLSAVGVIILLAVIIGVAANNNDKPSRPCQSEGKWKSVKRGLEFYPKPQNGSVVISFKSKDFYDLKDGPIKKSLDSVMEAYKGINQLNSSVYTDCNSTYAPASKTCKILTQVFGQYCVATKSYGYETQQPCVLLQLNLLDGESIRPISDKSPLWDAAKKVMEGHTDPSSVPVTCEGKTEADRDTINSRKGYGREGRRIDYFPLEGFPSYIYRPRDISLPLIKPAVMVQLSNIPKQHLIHMQCVIWGQVYNEKDEPISHDLLTTEFAVCNNE